MSKGVCIETFSHLMMVSLEPKQIIYKNFQAMVEMAFPMLIDFWFPISPPLTAGVELLWSVADLLNKRALRRCILEAVLWHVSMDICVKSFDRAVAGVECVDPMLALYLHSLLKKTPEEEENYLIVQLGRCKHSTLFLKLFSSKIHSRNSYD